MPRCPATNAAFPSSLKLAGANDAASAGNAADDDVDVSTIARPLAPERFRNEGRQIRASASTQPSHPGHTLAGEREQTGLKLPKYRITISPRAESHVTGEFALDSFASEAAKKSGRSTPYFN